jgi:S1-C subfamily serine protease
MASMQKLAVVRATVASLALLASTPLGAQRESPATVLPGPPWRDALILNGPGAQIGAAFRNLTAAEAQQTNSNSVLFDSGGVVIEKVSADSPASRAGLLKGDRITMFDGHRVRNASEFSRLVEETPPGWTVGMTVIRGTKLLKLSIAPTHVTA